MDSKRRAFLGTLGVGLLGAGHLRTQLSAATQAPGGSGGSGRGATPPPARKVKTTPLFQSPERYPNAIAVAPQGLWIAEQKSDHAVLTDWRGKLLKTVPTASKNTSGMGYGGGFIWMGANAAPHGIFQTSLEGKTVSHRQIPLGPAGASGGGCHGVLYHEGKLWITALRLRGILRVDPNTWTPEFLIPTTARRLHGLAMDDKGAIWLVTGSGGGDTGEPERAGLAKYDSKTGQLLETAVFAETECDPHGLAFHDGVMYSCDAGIHPGWPDDKSPTHGYIFQIELV